jgi:hypothetical protein
MRRASVEGDRKSHQSGQRSRGYGKVPPITPPDRSVIISPAETEDAGDQAVAKGVSHNPAPSPGETCGRGIRRQALPGSTSSVGLAVGYMDARGSTQTVPLPERCGLDHLIADRQAALWPRQGAVVFLMDLWAILLTAIVGLAGGQIGAWLQGRRDAQAQNAREGSEIERLRLQLAASREQRERELKQADTLEWRERRLAVYLKASTDVDAFMNKTDSAPSCTTPADFSTLADLSSSLLQAMSQTLDVSANIGTEATRTAAVSLVEKAEDALLVVARLLAQAPSHVLFEQAGLVSESLRHAQALGGDVAERVMRTMALSDNFHVRTVWADEASGEDVQQRDRAAKVASQLPRGSIERKFFEALAEDAEQRISWSTDRTEPNFDGRDW